MNRIVHSISCIAILAIGCGSPSGGSDAGQDAGGDADSAVEEDSTDSIGLCHGVSCGGHGRCLVEEEVARCDCDPSFHAVGLDCLPDEAGSACQAKCLEDSDCTLSLMNLGYHCVDSRCVQSCATDAQCVPIYSGWVFDCTSGGDECSAYTMTCIDVGGEKGKCATAPGILSCLQLEQVEVLMPRIDGTGNVIVCAKPGGDGAKCRDGFCFGPCAGNNDCVDFTVLGRPTCDTVLGECICTQASDCAEVRGHPACDTSTGTCACATDDDCAGSETPGFQVCRSGRCGCAADTDCNGVAQADTCRGGFCGCSSVSVCSGTPPFDGTSWVCE